MEIYITAVIATSKKLIFDRFVVAPVNFINVYVVLNNSTTLIIADEIMRLSKRSN